MKNRNSGTNLASAGQGRSDRHLELQKKLFGTFEAVIAKLTPSEKQFFGAVFLDHQMDPQLAQNLQIASDEIPTKWGELILNLNHRMLAALEHDPELKKSYQQITRNHRHFRQFMKLAKSYTEHGLNEVYQTVNEQDTDELT